VAFEYSRIAGGWPSDITVDIDKKFDEFWLDWRSQDYADNIRREPGRLRRAVLSLARRTRLDRLPGASRVLGQRRARHARKARDWPGTGVV